MTEMKDSQFYISVIEGDYSKLLHLFKDEPAELRESMVMNHAFDMLEELEDKNIINQLLVFIDDDLDNFDGKKCGALSVLGVIGSHEHELLIESYMDSSNHHLSYTALCSMCQLLERGELSDKTADRLISRLVSTLSLLDCSVEQAAECARALKAIGYRGIDEMIKKASTKMPNLAEEIEDGGQEKFSFFRQLFKSGK